jgi:hypothetical protein
VNIILVEQLPAPEQLGSVRVNDAAGKKIKIK